MYHVSDIIQPELICIFPHIVFLVFVEKKKNNNLAN